MSTKLDTFKTYKKQLETELAQCDAAIQEIHRYSREVGREREDIRRQLTQKALALIKDEATTIEDRRLFFEILAEYQLAHFEKPDRKTEVASQLLTIDTSLRDSHMTGISQPILLASRDMEIQNEAFHAQFGNTDPSAGGIVIDSSSNPISGPKIRLLGSNDQTGSIDLPLHSSLVRVFSTSSLPEETNSHDQLASDKKRRTDVVIGRTAVDKYLQLHLSSDSEQAKNELWQIGNQMSYDAQNLSVHEPLEALWSSLAVDKLAHEIDGSTRNIIDYRAVSKLAQLIRLPGDREDILRTTEAQDPTKSLVLEGIFYAIDKGA